MQRVGVLALLSDDVANNPNRVLLDILVLGVQRGDDGLHGYLILDDGRDGLVFLVAGELPQRLEHDLEIALHVAQQRLEGDLLLVGVVDQHPQLPRVGFYDLEDVRLLADDLVARCDHRHLPDVHRIDAEVQWQVLLKFLDDCLRVFEVLLLERGQDP